MGKKKIIDLNMNPAKMLEKIYNWLQKRSTESGKAWPELHRELVEELDLIFTVTANGDTGDYSRPEVQALYLLRYLNCYAYGYMDMYRTFLETYGAELKSLNKSKLFVTSLGCGNQIDLWGLCDAIRQVNGPIQLPVSYAGVDINPWAKEFLLFPSAFVERGIADYLNMSPPKYRSAADVYVFAKCISEFNPAERRKICKGLQKLLNKHPEQQKLWILFYLRTKKDGQPYDQDIEICRSICSSVEEAGYIMEGSDEPPEPWGGEDHIHDQDKRFLYPRDIKEDLANNGSIPMNKTKNIYYWITHFERPF